MAVHGDKRPAPAVDRVTPASNISSCILLEVERARDDFVRRFTGTRTGGFMPKPMTGRRMTESPAQAAPGKVRDSRIVVRDEKRPLSGEALCVRPKKEIAKMGDIMLPLSSDGKTVTTILVGPVEVDFFRAETTEPFQAGVPPTVGHFAFRNYCAPGFGFARFACAFAINVLTLLLLCQWRRPRSA